MLCFMFGHSQNVFITCGIECIRTEVDVTSYRPRKENDIIVGVSADKVVV